MEGHSASVIPPSMSQLFAVFAKLSSSGASTTDNWLDAEFYAGWCVGHLGAIGSIEIESGDIVLHDRAVVQRSFDRLSERRSRRITMSGPDAADDRVNGVAVATSIRETLQQKGAGPCGRDGPARC